MLQRVWATRRRRAVTKLPQHINRCEECGVRIERAPPDDYDLREIIYSFDNWCGTKYIIKIIDSSYCCIYCKQVYFPLTARVVYVFA